MSDIGESVRARRTRLGMTQKELADEAGVNRDTLGAIESGKGHTQRKLTQIEAALDRLEGEAGLDAPPLAVAGGEAELIEFSVADEMGLHIVVKGPLSDADALRRQVMGIIREIRGQEGDTPNGKG